MLLEHFNDFYFFIFVCVSELTTVHNSWSTLDISCPVLSLCLIPLRQDFSLNPGLGLQPASPSGPLVTTARQLEGYATPSVVSSVGAVDLNLCPHTDLASTLTY